MALLQEQGTHCMTHNFSQSLVSQNCIGVKCVLYMIKTHFVSLSSSYFNQLFNSNKCNISMIKHFKKEFILQNH